MADLTQIAASIAAPSLSSALQQAPDLPAGQSIEAKVAQIISNEIVRLASSLGTFDLKASHPALQPGVTVRLDVSENGEIRLTLPQVKAGLYSTTPQSATPSPATALPNPAVINSLGGQQPAPSPVTYSATGQTVQPGAQSIAPQTVQAAVIQAPLLAENQPPVNPAAPAVQPAAVPPVAADVAQPGTPAIAPQASPNEAPAVPSPPAIVSAALGDALAKQGSIAPLLANAESLVSSGKPLPQSLAAAIEDVLQAVKPLSENITPQAVEQAVKRSGAFLENSLAKLASNPATSDALKLDFKNLLLKLVDVIEALPKDTPQKPDPLAPRPPPPPHGTEAPEPQAAGKPTLSASSTQQDIAATLGRQAEAALSRVRVLQFASMPTSLDVQDAQTRPAQIWHLDIPMLINGQGSVIPLQIEREAEKREAQAAHHRWRVRFAVDLDELGAVHALLALGGGMVDVTLWAERRETYDLFKTMAKDLHYALMDEELDVAEIEFRSGSPRAAAIRAGSHLDTRT